MTESQVATRTPARPRTALPRPAQVALTGIGVLLLGGLLGLAWWSWHRRSGRTPSARFRRIRLGLFVAGLVIIAIGTAWRVMVAASPVPVCSGPPSVHAQAIGRQPSPTLIAEKAATWPETGIAMMYAKAVGAPDCRSRAADYYVAIHANDLAGARAVNMGDIVLSPVFDISREHMIALANHEARHRPQWAVATVIGGPFAFPIAYAIDDFFFPGARNHFERQAGLETGGYRHVGGGPVLGPAQIAVLCAIPVVIAAIVLVRRRRPRDRQRR